MSELLITDLLTDDVELQDSRSATGGGQKGAQLPTAGNSLPPECPRKSIVETWVYVRAGIFSIRSVYSCVLPAVYESVSQSATLRR